MKKILLFIFLLINSFSVFGQIYNMPNSGTQSISTCSGVVCDNGGLSGNYSNNYLGSITINPSNPNSRIKLEFTSFSFENNFDLFYIYDGVNTSAPLIGQFSTNPGTVMASNATGAITIQVLTDPTNQFLGFSANISCVPLPKCDLITSNCINSPTSILPGKSIMVSCKVLNIDEKASTSSNLGYFLSQDNTFDGSDVFIGNSSVSPILSGGVANKTASIVIPGNTAAGNYYIIYFADFDSTQSEINENNNSTSVPITIIQPYVDLKMNSFSAADSIVANGSVVAIQANYGNYGNIPSNNCNLAFYLSLDSNWDISDVNIGNNAGAAISNGSTYNMSDMLNIPMATLPGNYFIIAFVDDQNLIPESNEVNNSLVIPISISVAFYDLNIISFVSSKINVSQGAAATLSYVFINNGNSVIGQTNSRFYLSVDSIFDATDTLLNSTYLPFLQPNQPSGNNINIMIPVNAIVGNYYILLLVDFENDITETNELNNLKYFSISILPSNPDFIIKTASLSNGIYTPGFQLDVNCSIFNQGDKSYSNSNVGYFYSLDSIWDASDILLNYNSNYKSLAQNTYVSASSKLVIPNTAVPGVAYILYYADFLNNENELDETNNIFSKKIQISSPFVDLSVLPPNSNTLEIIQGNSFSISGKFKNLGTVGVNNVPFGYFISLDSIWDITDSLVGISNYGIFPNATNYYYLSTTIMPTMSVGNYFIIIMADYLNQVPELNEQNNFNFLPLNVVESIQDLKIEFALISNEVISPGVTLYLENSIENTGNKSISNCLTGYYISNDSIWDGADLLIENLKINTINPSIKVNQMVNFSIPTDLKTGKYYLILVADYINTINEVNEGNNFYYLPFNIVNEYFVQEIGNNSIVTCSGILYDNGGLNNYVNNSNGTFTIYPDEPGKKVALNFNSFDVDFWSNDGISIYDGENTSATLLCSFNGYSNDNPTFYSAKNNLGALTVKFYSDYSDVQFGFDAIISCLNTPSYPDLSIEYATNSVNNLTAGGQSNVKFIIKNKGENISLFNEVGFYLSTDSIRDVNDLLLGSKSVGEILPGKIYEGNFTFGIPYTILPNQYYLIPYVDHLNSNLELNEKNNSKAIQFTVSISDIDFVINSGSISPKVFLYLNGPFNPYVYSVIGNDGSSPASDVKVGYFISTDSLFDNGDLIVGNYSSNYLVSGGSESKYSSINIPSTMLPGSYYLLMVADYINAITESDEGNNTKILPFTVALPSVDLIIQNQLNYYPTVVQGNYAGLSCKINNLGIASSPSNSIGYYLSVDSIIDGSDINLGSQLTNIISPNIPIQYYFNFIIPNGVLPGSYYVLFKADNLNVVSELNEFNNVKNVKINIVAPYIDLAITNLTFSNTKEIQNGDYIGINHELRNYGNSDAGTSTTGYFLSYDTIWDSSDLLLKTLVSTTLGAYNYINQYGNSIIPTGTPNGNYYIILFADYLNNIIESNENNNAITYVPVAVVSQFLVPATGMLSITTCDGVLQDPGGQLQYGNNSNGTLVIYPGIIGNYVTLKFNHFNLSTNDLMVIYDGIDTTSAVIATLIGPNSYNFIPGPFMANNPTGALTITFKSNSTYTNQGFDAVIGCEPNLPLPDLILNPTSFNTNIIQGSSFSLSTEIKNIGINTANSSNIGFYLSLDNNLDPSDILLNNSTSGILKPDTKALYTKVVTIPILTIPGQYFILFVADDLNSVLEENEANNSTAIPINILPQYIDLAINTQYVNPLIVARGSITSANCNVASLGNKSVSSSNIGYYLSTDNQLDSTDVFLGSIIANYLFNPNYIFTTNLTIPSITPIGNYYILFFVDFTKNLSEAQESNNFGFVPITVINSDVDLQVSLAYSSSSIYETGISKATTVLLSNNGNTTALKDSVVCFLSQDSILDATDLKIGIQNYGNVIPGKSSISTTNYITVPNSVMPGNYFLLYYVDNSNNIIETNENNNMYVLPISVKAASIDFAISPVNYPKNTIVGQSYYFNSIVYNLGGSTSSSSSIGYYLSADSIFDTSDKFLSKADFYKIDGNNNYSVNGFIIVPTSTIPGSYYIICKVDYLNTNIEVNENNNYASFKITVSTSLFADLMIQNASLGNSVSTNGGALVPAYGNIYNNGMQSIMGYEISYYLSYDNVYDGSDYLLSQVNSSNYLPINSQKSCNKNLIIPFAYTSGNYYIVFYVDSKNDLLESDETNNIVIIPYQLTTNLVNIEVENSELSVYPNPNSGKFQLKIDVTKGELAEIRIYNNLGVEIERRKVICKDNTFQESFDLGNLTPGLYSILVKVGASSFTRKLSIE